MEVLRYTAFSADVRGGNPAGVVLDATGADEETMLRVAAELGYSETAFLVPRADRHFDVRYFSPRAEVPFCGHATVASAVAYARRYGVGPLTFDTAAGRVEVVTAAGPDGAYGAALVGSALISAALISVAPRVEPLADADLDALLQVLRWRREELDPALPPRVAYAGARHPIVAAGSRSRLAALDYDFDALGSLMARRDWTTIDLVWRESDAVFHARNPFPPGGIVEDPATGAAAAAFGGYLRELGVIALPATIAVHQGDDLGRPGLLTVTIPAEVGSGIRVAGTAVPIT